MALSFFVSYIVITIYLILNVLLAATYSGWKEQHSRGLLDLRVQRYHNLLLAWAVKPQFHRTVCWFNRTRSVHLIESLTISQSGIAQTATTPNQAYGAREKGDGARALTLYQFSENATVVAPNQCRH